MYLFERLFVFFGSLLIRLRYKITCIGKEKILEKGNKGILFLPNHVALIDSIIIFSILFKKFWPRAIADANNVDFPLIRDIAKRYKVRTIPDMCISAPEAKAEVEAVLNECIQDLENGENVLLFPSGRLKRQHREIIGATSAVEDILKKNKNIRIVIIRQNGFWGSMFSWGQNVKPHLIKGFLRGFKILLGNLIFFAPRRALRFEFVEPEDFPRDGDRLTINRYLEDFYNAENQANTYVPYYFWKFEKTHALPERQSEEKRNIDLDSIPIRSQQEVLKYLQEKIGQKNITPDMKLAGDLGMDSIAISEMAVWISQEFGTPPANTDSYVTVADAMFATTNNLIATGPLVFHPVPKEWFATWKNMDEQVVVPKAENIAYAVLDMARKYPKRAIIADQISGVKTYRDILLFVMVLRPLIQKFPEDTVGIMMPAGVIANILYLAVMFSGKVPVMVNWTTGSKNMRFCLDNVGTKHILTSRTLLTKLQTQGLKFEGLEDYFIALEDFSTKIGKFSKLSAFLRSRFCWRSLYKAKIANIATILFTSGSESTPKSVPLTHKNIMSNLASLHGMVVIKQNDILMGILPPFHSFGLSITTVYPLIMGIRTVYHANPTESFYIARCIEEYKTSGIISTPTFVQSLLRVITKKQIQYLRLIVTGAEKCSDALYEKMRQLAPHAIILEGYGATECSPVISLNHENNIVRGSLGNIAPGFEYAIIHVDKIERVPVKEIGRLILRGDSVFEGYINYQGQSPFIEFEGKQWYNTGDLVYEDENNILFFAGRLKRFIKIAGEMISLPAIEEALLPHCGDPDAEVPQIAVESTNSEENPEIILFSVVDLDRGFVNQCIRNAGLSGLHNIRTIYKIDEIPLLGTGKVNYHFLKAMLESESI
ncbi:MAG TPA: AMP-binding protein [Planctomycetota bacterium]|nr:AMP-binding protein [Planctomycetota bacterium]